MIVHVTRLLSLALAIAALNSPPAIGAECLKQVFHTYCLGGNIDELTARKRPVVQTPQLDRNAFVFQDQGGYAYVGVFDGRIESVTRLYLPGTMRIYEEVRYPLRKVYGEGTHSSTLPDYARDSSTIELAISLGQGGLLDSWQNQGWSILLVWDHPKRIALTYRHDELHQKLHNNEARR